MTQFTAEDFTELADQLRTSSPEHNARLIDKQLSLILVALDHMAAPVVTVDVWQPIETAPTDGSYVIGRRVIGNNKLVCVVSWRFWTLGDDVLSDLQPTFRWRDANGRHFSPTEWMRIPE